MRSIRIDDTTDDIHGEGVTITFREGHAGLKAPELHDSRLKPAHLSIMQAWLRSDDEVFHRLMQVYGREELGLRELQRAV